MLRNMALASAVVFSVLLGFPNRARAIDPVTAWIGSYIGGHILDEVWDRITNKPDVGKLARRLQTLEQNAALDRNMREEIRRVRVSLNNRVTKAELRRVLSGLQNQLGTIKDRLDTAEQNIELNAVQIEDIQKGTYNSKSARYFLDRGRGCAAQKKYHRAIANFALAIRLDPKLTFAYVARARVYKDRMLQEVAILDYSKAISLDAKCTPALKERGKLYNERRESWKAIADMSAVLSRHPKDAEALAQRGFAYINTSYYTRAIADYQACLKVAPTFADGWYNLGFAYQKQGYHSTALASFSKAVNLDAREARYHAGRAVSCYHLGKYTDAIGDCDKALKLDGNLLAARETRGLSHYALGRYTRALPDLSRAISLGSSDHRVYESRGKWYCVAKQHSLAVADLDRAIRLGARGWRLYEYRAVANYNRRWYHSAIGDYTVVIRANPSLKTTASAYWWRGQAHLQNGNLASYRADVTSALFRDSSYQKQLSAGHVLVRNNTTTPITINVDYWIYPNGTKESFKLPFRYKIGAGQSTYLLYNKNQLVAKKFQAYVETSKGRKLYYWNYRSGVHLDVTVNKADLP